MTKKKKDKLNDVEIVSGVLKVESGGDVEIVSEAFKIDGNVKLEGTLVDDNRTTEPSRVIGYAKDNDGNEMKEHPLEAFADMVILENVTKSSTSKQLEKYGDFDFGTEIGEHQDLGGWRVVATGEFVTRVQVGDLVGNPIGNSATHIFHPAIAKRTIVKDQFGNDRQATKEDYDYVYVIVNMKLIGMRY